MLRISVWVVGVAVLISGCAAPTPKPAMTSDAYESYAYRWAGFDICGAEGKMDPSLAALGKTNTRYAMYGTHSFDVAEMDRQIRRVGYQIRPASAELCNRLAVDAAGQRDTYERNTRANQTQSQPQWTQPKTTNCMTTYGWTRCTTN